MRNSKLVWEDFGDRMHLFDPAQTIQLHEAIFDAIQSHDAQAARFAMKQHLEVGYKFYLPPSPARTGASPVASKHMRPTYDRLC